MTASPSVRHRLAQKLVSVKHDTARKVTDEFFLSHPDWDIRFGARGRQHCTADACFHLEFLAGAIEGDSPEAFANYSRWTARMLSARGIDAHTLEEHLTLLENCLSASLLPEERQAISIFLARARQVCADPESISHAQSPADQLALVTQVYLAAILRGHRQVALNIVQEALRDGHSHVDIYVKVFAAALRRIGELWEVNQITVAQEHMATSITQYVIAVIYPGMVPARIQRGNMVVTGVAGELHQIGANLVADTMEAHGWAVRFLGTNLPHSSVLAAIEENSASVLCISTTILANLPSVAELLGVVRGKLNGNAPRILLGGAAYQLAPKFASEVGAMSAVTGLQQGLDMLCP